MDKMNETKEADWAGTSQRVNVVDLFYFKTHTWVKIAQASWNWSPHVNYVQCIYSHLWTG